MKFQLTEAQARIAEKVGYVIDGDNKHMLRGKISYVIDTAKRSKSFSIEADFIGPDYATDCEQKLWQALTDALER